MNAHERGGKNQLTEGIAREAVDLTDEVRYPRCGTIKLRDCGVFYSCLPPHR